MDMQTIQKGQVVYLMMKVIRPVSKLKFGAGISES